MTEARRRGRPTGSNFESLDFYDQVEHTENQIERLIRARSSSDNGYQNHEDVIAERYRQEEEAQRERNRQAWAWFWVRVAQSHRRQAADLERRAVELCPHLRQMLEEV